MKILLFGGSGQLGLEIMQRAGDLNFDIVAPVISELDIVDEKQVHFIANKVQPDLVINCAAYTAVDKAEEEKEQAFQINRDGAAHVARAAREVGARLIHLSTDYVFAGTGSTPLSELDQTNPCNVYGDSKLAGERLVQDIVPDRSLIVRTSSLHGRHGANFVHTMIKLMVERDVVKVVNDQFMSPTWAGWLAETLLDLGRMDCSGVVHASCLGSCSWFEFASEIRALISSHLSIKANLEPIAAIDFARPAPRPQYSVFDCAKLDSLLGRTRLGWREGLQSHLVEIDYGRALTW